jgi:hypothetical protein
VPHLLFAASSLYDDLTSLAFKSLVQFRHYELGQACGTFDGLTTVGILLTPRKDGHRPWDTSVVRVWEEVDYDTGPAEVLRRLWGAARTMLRERCGNPTWNTWSNQAIRACENRPEGCIYSDPGHDQQLSLGPFGPPRTLGRAQGDVSTPGESGDTSPNPGQLLASALPCGPPHDVIPRRHPEMNHGVRYGPTMLRKQVSRPVDSLDPPP